jgi:hypothetical protein
MTTATGNVPANHRHRIARLPGLFSLLVLGLLVGSSAPSAQQKPLLKFTPLAPGLEGLRLWEIVEGPRWPEIALLPMSDGVHAESHKDPSAFVNRYQIFPAPVQPGARCEMVRLGEETKSRRGGCVATVSHDSNSTIT